MWGQSPRFCCSHPRLSDAKRPGFFRDDLMRIGIADPWAKPCGQLSSPVSRREDTGDGPDLRLVIWWSEVRAGLSPRRPDLGEDDAGVVADA